MKLAEALRERADLQKKISALSPRMTAAARHLEGETPEESAEAILAEARLSIIRLMTLVQRINRTNAGTLIDRETLSDMIARRDALHSERQFLIATADAAAGTSRHDLLYGRRSRATELREVAALPVPDLRAEIDRLAAEHRELDARIQLANWSTELL